MGVTKNPILALMFALWTLFGSSLGAVHKVGDSAGWTMMGVDYDKWASTKTFHVGDSLVFQYNSDDHDVREVTHESFLICGRSSPLATYETGSDSVTLTRPGHYYFLCGVPDHCDSGQKVDIMVMPASLRPVSAPITSAPVAAPLSTSPSFAASSPENRVAYSPEVVVPAQNGAVRARVLICLSFLSVLLGACPFS